MPPISTGNAFPYASETGSDVVTSRDFISFGFKSEFFCNNKAAAPDTCGAAKLVPLVKLYFPSIKVVFTNAPGATKSGLM